MSSTFSMAIVVIINVVFMAFGTAILALGIVFQVGWEDIRDAFGDKTKDGDFNLQHAADMLGMSGIVFGAFILVLSLIGCIGACCRIRLLLVVYSIAVLLILIAQIVVVAVVAINGDEAESTIIKGLRESLNNYTEDSSTSRSKSWSVLFSTIECCGVVSFVKDFNRTNFVMSGYRTDAQKNQNPIMPVTCCKNFEYENALTAKIFKDTNINDCLIKQTEEFAYTKGCESKIKDFIVDNKAILLGVGITLIFIEVLVVILGFVLCCRHDEDGA